MLSLPFKSVLPWLLIAGGLAAGGAAAASWLAFGFSALDGATFLSRLGALLVFSLLIERTVEVFLTIWRGEESYKLEAEVQRLISDKAADADIKAAQERLIAYRAETQRWALPSSFLIALTLACFGVRVIGQFVQIPADVSADSLQASGFRMADIVLTATLLAGGADPIHKVMDTIRKFMEASSAKVSGTVKP